MRPASADAVTPPPLDKRKAQGWVDPDAITERHVFLDNEDAAPAETPADDTR